MMTTTGNYHLHMAIYDIGKHNSIKLLILTS